MNIQNLIPIPDSIPVPWGWFQFLLLLTFILHLLFMNVMLGMTAIALFESIRKPREVKKGSIPWEVSRKLPYTIAFTVNLGVAPLLFIQVLYGHFIYVSSLLMAVFWLSLLVLLILAYYSAYLYDFKFSSLGGIKNLFPAFSLMCFLLTGFLFTNNMTLMIQPKKWIEYFNQSGGLILNLSDPSIWPRYLHFVTASLAIGGLFLALLGYFQQKNNPPAGQSKIDIGMGWFTYGTIFQVFVGLWFLISLPKDIMLEFMGNNTLYTVVLLAGILLGLLSIILGFQKKVVAASIHALTIVIVMVFLRDFLRHEYLKEYFSMSDLKLAAQYSPLFLFLITFVAGLVIVAYMLKSAVIAGKAVE